MSRPAKVKFTEVILNCIASAAHNVQLNERKRQVSYPAALAIMIMLPPRQINLVFSMGGPRRDVWSTFVSDCVLGLFGW